MRDVPRTTPNQGQGNGREKDRIGIIGKTFVASSAAFELNSGCPILFSNSAAVEVELKFAEIYIK